jgi:glycosyltransferase involved in cell wall biosynthesis
VFVNSGILGHRAVARLIEQATASCDGFQAEHVNLSDGLTVPDRIVRRALGLQLAPTSGFLANIDLRRWRLELNVGWLAARRIQVAERRGALHALHFHPQATAYGSLARMKRVPSIVSIDATQRPAIDEATSPLSRSTYRAGMVHDGAVFRAATQIVATSQWAARDVAAMYPDCADKVHVMPYPIDSGLFDGQWIEERAARAAANPRSIVRVLFVGGDFPRKGGLELLQAWRSSNLDSRAALDIVTDWPLEAEDLPPGVNLIRGVSPYTPSWRELWRQADFFVMPTRQEAFGMVYQEAAAAGLPVVATNLNAIPEIVEDRITGILIESGNLPSLVSAMRTLVESAELRHRMGTAAYQRIARVADPSGYAAKLENIVQHVMASDVRQPA